MAKPKPPQDEGYYFGWVCESALHGPDRFDFGIHGEPLSAEVLKEFEEIIGLFGRIRPSFIDFLSFRAEYLELLKLPDLLLAIYQSTQFPIIDVGVRTINTHVVAERRLSAFLNSASSFRDRLLTRLSGEHKLKGVLTRRLSEIYDRSFSYRLCYNLRNYSQHRSSPLSIIPVNATRDEVGTLTYKIDLELERDRLTDEQSKFQPKVKAELRRLDPRIPLIDNCRQYYRDLRETFLAYLAFNGTDIHAAIGYETAVRRTVPHMPSHAAPLLFKGKPKEGGGEFKCNVTSFSFDELALLKGVLLEAMIDRADDGMGPHGAQET